MVLLQQRWSLLGACWECRVSSPTQELLRQNLPFARCPGIDGETLEKPQCGLHTNPGFIQSFLDSRAFQLICDIFPLDEEQLISPSSAWHQDLHRTCPPAPAQSHTHLLPARRPHAPGRQASGLRLYTSPELAHCQARVMWVVQLKCMFVNG